MNLLTTTPLRQKKERNGFKATGLARRKARKA